MILALIIFVDARNATGTATTAPKKEPRMDILIVSNNGRHKLGKYSHLGGIISPPMITKNSYHLLINCWKSKLVNRKDKINPTRTNTRIIGVRDLFSFTTLPLASTIFFGGKILSYINFFPFHFFHYVFSTFVNMI